MSSDDNGREPGTSALDTEGLMFPADPVWDRKKRRGANAAPRTAAQVMPLSETPSNPTRIDPEPRTFAAETPRAMTSTTVATDDGPMVAPTVAVTPRATQTTRKSGPSPAVLALALGAVVVLGGAGFYAMQPRDGIATLTPGEPTVSDMAAAPVVTSDVDMATNTLPPRATAPTAAAPMQVARQSAPAAAPTARARPARAAATPSADANVANVNATLSDGPRPYTTINPTAPTQVNPPAAAPAPVEAAPLVVIPTTPPVQQSAPTPEETTPPT